MSRASFISRSKEIVWFDLHCTELDGSVTRAVGARIRTQWVYRREDGSEFVDLRAQHPVQRIAGRPSVNLHCKKVAPVILADLINRRHKP